MMKIPFDPNGKEKAAAAAKQGAQWLRGMLQCLKPARKTVFKGCAALLLLGAVGAAGANYLPKLAGQSNLTAVEAAQAAFGATNGGIITEAEFDIGRQGSRYEFEILSGGRKYDVNVDAMSGEVSTDDD